MTTSKKKLLAVLFVLWGLPLLLIFGGAAWVSQAGMIVVDVKEHGPGGSNVHVRVPAAMVQLALPFVPDVMCEDTSGDFERWSPVVRELCGELERMEDGVLVEVTGGRENVQIMKKKGSLTIDVDSDDETVHIVMPIGTVSAVLSKLETMKGEIRIDGKDRVIRL
jgi:hypothetical protein